MAKHLDDDDNNTVDKMFTETCTESFLVQYIQLVKLQGAISLLSSSSEPSPIKKMGSDIDKDPEKH